MHLLRARLSLDYLRLPKWGTTVRRLAPLAGTVRGPNAGPLGSGQARSFSQQPSTRTLLAGRSLLPFQVRPPTSTRRPSRISPYSTAVTTPLSHAREPTIHPVFEPTTCTYQYVVADPATQTAVIIDPVLDYDQCTRTVTTSTADSLIALVRGQGYRVSHVLETHAHADHLTAAFYLQRRFAELQEGARPKVGIGKRIGKAQQLFAGQYGVGKAEYEGVFDVLWEDDEVFEVGELRAKVLHLPGHTEDHVGYWIGDNVFCGDSLFHPSLGSARCDFPGGNPHALYRSAKKLLSLEDYVRIWTGHDYPVEGKRAPAPWSTVADHKEKNVHLRHGISEEEFVAMRMGRDRRLTAPRLIHESLQVNIRAGHVPKELRVPVQVQAPLLL